MDLNTMLEMVKVDLGISGTAYDQRLTQYIESAKAALKTEGITLTEDISDGNLVVMYAAFLWRKRDYSAKYAGESNVGMPRMLRWLINNRVFQEKVSE